MKKRYSTIIPRPGTAVLDMKFEDNFETAVGGILIPQSATDKDSREEVRARVLAVDDSDPKERLDTIIRVWQECEMVDGKDWAIFAKDSAEIADQLLDAARKTQKNRIRAGDVVVVKRHAGTEIEAVSGSLKRVVPLDAIVCVLEGYVVPEVTVGEKKVKA